MAKYIPEDYRVTKKIALSIFDKTFNNDNEGRLAYNPVILLKIIK